MIAANKPDARDGLWPRVIRAVRQGASVTSTEAVTWLQIPVESRRFAGGNQVPIEANHGFGLVADPGIDDSLIDTGGSAVGTKRVSENVPALELLPLAVGERLLEMVVNVVASNRHRLGPFLLAALTSR